MTGSASWLTGYVTLNPALVQVCVGHQFKLTCTTTESNLVWNFVPPLINNQGNLIQGEWLIGSQDLTQQQQQITVNSTSVTLVRTSMQYASPLVSTITAINSSTGLNMANVSCTEIIGDGFEPGMVELTAIIVIGDIFTGLINLLAYSVM